MNRQQVRQIFIHLRAANPHPHSELLFDTPFQLLIAVILSAQATDKSVNVATRALFRDAPTPAAMVKLGLPGIKRYIRTIGLYNSKARNILATCRLLIERHGRTLQPVFGLGPGAEQVDGPAENFCECPRSTALFRTERLIRFFLAALICPDADADGLLQAVMRRPQNTHGVHQVFQRRGGKAFHDQIMRVQATAH